MRVCVTTETGSSEDAVFGVSLPVFSLEVRVDNRVANAVPISFGPNIGGGYNAFLSTIVDSSHNTLTWSSPPGPFGDGGREPDGRQCALSYGNSYTVLAGQNVVLPADYCWVTSDPVDGTIVHLPVLQASVDQDASFQLPKLTPPPPPPPWSAAIGALIPEDQDVTKGNRYSYCQGTVVQSRHGNVVLTAGHCAWGGGHLFSHIAFAPGFHGQLCKPKKQNGAFPSPAELLRCGHAPYGIWNMSGLPVTQYRGDNGTGEGRKKDWAFITMAPNDGKSIADVVGALPIAFNQPEAQQWTAYARPAPHTFVDPLHSCAASGSPTQPNFGPMLNCTSDPLLVIPGDSGGPWLDPRGAVGAVNSQIGSGYLFLKLFKQGYLFGSLLDQAAAAAYHEISSR